MMAAVKRGGDRQQLHEIIREASMQETAKMKTAKAGIWLPSWPPGRNSV